MRQRPFLARNSTKGMWELEITTKRDVGAGNHIGGVVTGAKNCVGGGDWC